MKRIIFNIAGGMGKNITATAVVRNIKRAYPEHSIVVTTPYADIWLNNPNVSEIVSIEKTPFFYRDYLMDPETLLLKKEPYHSSDFVSQKKHLVEIWCDLAGVPCVDMQPELFFTDEEIAKAEKMTKGNFPTFFIQTSGGAPNQAFPVSWARDLPMSLAERICIRMNEEGYKIHHIRRPDQLSIPGTEMVNLPIREVMCMLKFSDKRLFIDSFAQHAAAAVGMPSVVTWVGNRPDVFGESIHTNILPKEKEQFRHYIDSYLEKYNITGSLHECPYNTDDIFDFDEIISKLLK